MLQFEDFVAGEVKQRRAASPFRRTTHRLASRYDAQDFHVDPEAAKASFVGRLIALRLA